MRIEVAEDVYPLAWVDRLEQWLHEHDTGFLRLVR